MGVGSGSVQARSGRRFVTESGAPRGMRRRALARLIVRLIARSDARGGAVAWALPGVVMACWMVTSGCGQTTRDATPGDGPTGGAGGLGGAAQGGRRTTAVELFSTGALRGRADAEDTRDEVVWTPPIALGSPGWRESGESLCIHDGAELGQVGELTSFGVWADGGTVTTSATWACAGDTGAACAAGGPTKVRANSGRGWQTVLQDEVGGRSAPATNQLSGFPSGPVVLLNYRSYDFSPSVAPADSVTFLATSTSTRSTFEPPLGASDAAFAVAAFGVLSAKGYVLIREGEPAAGSSVHRYFERSWSQVDVIPSAAQAIWASDARVLVAASDGIYESAVSRGTFLPRVDAPSADYTSVWALTEDDVWAGTSHGELVHFDGQRWTVFESGTQGAITRLWGGDSEVFYMSDALLGRFKDGAAETLISTWAGARLWDVWGRSAREVFVTLTDAALANYRCGAKRMLWFDGVEFHSF